MLQIKRSEMNRIDQLIDDWGPYESPKVYPDDDIKLLTRVVKQLMLDHVIVTIVG